MAAQPNLTSLTKADREWILRVVAAAAVLQQIAVVDTEVPEALLFKGVRGMVAALRAAASMDWSA